MNPADFEFIRTYLYKKCAIVLTPNKEYLVESRLAPLVKEYKLNGISDLCVHIQGHPGSEADRKFVDVMTTNETSFFRDITPFETLRDKIMPELIGKRMVDKKINIWCGAASCGQEPYTIAMTILEYFPTLINWKIKILATDICRSVLAQAKAGKYNQFEVNRGLTSNFLAKYFRKVNNDYFICDAAKSMIDFQEMNLVAPWILMPSLDIVFLRNVLIYFDNETKKGIFEKMRKNMKKDASLFLGSAESTFGIDDHFIPVFGNKSAYYRLKET